MLTETARSIFTEATIPSFASHLACENNALVVADMVTMVNVHDAVPGAPSGLLHRGRLDEQDRYSGYLHRRGSSEGVHDAPLLLEY